MGNKFKYISIAAGPLLACIIWFCFDLNPANKATTYMAGLAVWMCVWWVTEAVSLAVTALLPIFFMPLLRIAPLEAVAPQYTDSIIFLFLGGFMLAFAIEKWGLHRRIAIKILSVVGTKPNRILMGVMLSTYLISNWISNTATTIMLLSAVLSLIDVVELKIVEQKDRNKFAAALLLGLAFSATIGGMATPVGTPPNMYFFNAYHKAYPEMHDLNFLTWAKIGYPISFLFLCLTYFVLSRYYLRKVEINFEKNYFKQELKGLGKFSFEEIVISIIFICCMVLWFTREEVKVDNFHFKGWGSLFGKMKVDERDTNMVKTVGDATVAIMAALLLFLIPSKNKKGEAILEWDDAKKIRYDIILMFGSGFALAYGFEQAGLSNWLAHSLEALKGTHVLVLTFSICVVVCLISEFASNIASIVLVMPIMIALQHKLNIPPLLLMIPATFAASLGFILPVATAANTIVFGTKRIFTRDMFFIGLILDIGGILLITVLTYLLL
ncbi:MAG: anion permease [Bacteroidia bacterium]|nr:anion permease [Bacteroidia bacterium]